MTSTNNIANSRRRLLLLATTAIASTMLPLLVRSDDKGHDEFDDEGKFSTQSNTTSPSRALPSTACGMSAIASTKTGSTLPATRSARASERPSAATMGASPAA